jgi:hypothetical protein
LIVLLAARSRSSCGSRRGRGEAAVGRPFPFGCGCGCENRNRGRDMGTRIRGVGRGRWGCGARAGEAATSRCRGSGSGGRRCRSARTGCRRLEEELEEVCRPCSSGRDPPLLRKGTSAHCQEQVVPSFASWAIRVEQLELGRLLRRRPSRAAWMTTLVVEGLLGYLGRR